VKNIKNDFYENNSLNDGLESEISKNSWIALILFGADLHSRTFSFGQEPFWRAHNSKKHTAPVVFSP